MIWDIRFAMSAGTLRFTAQTAHFCFPLTHGRRHTRFWRNNVNIQIFGKSKCFDTKKAERWFQERRIKFQRIDLLKFGMSGGEFDSVLRAVGGIDKLIDWDGKDEQITLMRYTDDVRSKEDRVFDDPRLMKTPIVRNGKQATVGYCPEIWSTWE